LKEKRIYEEKKKNFFTACSLEEPEWVPVGLDAITWPIAYAGKKTYDLLGKPKELTEAVMKIYLELDLDFCTDIHRNLMPLKTIEALGGKGYVMSSDGITIQHTMQVEIMRADEYPEFIEDSINFKLNVLPRRKFSKTNGTREEFKQACLDAFEQMKLQNETSMLLQNAAEEAGIIIAWDPMKMPGHPLDTLFDFYRGFKGLLIDLRRQPEKVEEAMSQMLEEILPMNLKIAEEIRNSDETYIIPIPGGGFHAVPYLNRKQFDRFWWPIFKQLILPIIEAGTKTFMKSEGKAGYCLDAFKELPKGSIIMQLEEDDPYENYKHFEGHMTLAGGISTSKLKLASIEDCKDEVKKAIDTFAPGGGYIFMADRALLGATDANPETLKATYAFAKEYGKY